ncbi:MAG: triose-phosphate isomerase [Candidatus Zambryskibacteria bacterium RIFOXYD1_FULL_40_13]|nr:MAG: Triosephosphate isomerase [Parcubacteria group bacterium GW2011_GWC1_39_12]KKR19406.1 MAG: Triosephosphate isomerase [Parcubacteria group bacterium GW2011_GWF1_39_37]KKR35212.1 MAG: Triosephosphate isomerase [Parcubacteria group bacterium GW2011_GWC2_40_10]KKR52355.1 MAG: Triosephosphate isomerase [Parcubacteria group bacterium GW2011_GWE1_40_20]KKR64638.1 MAG: Triosephosphate isomerase [Parcubacteria group bacterium GW2011_GWB1_40_5]KKR69419.1 MAG: Triosephosphate isomerase [Parcubact
MKKVKKLVVGNWKMNPTSLEEAKKLVLSVKRSTRNLKRTEVVLCPPFIYLSAVSGFTGENIFLGAQNANHETVGSFTGEVSFAELSQFKVDYVILGHSERRKMGESDELINKKVRSVVGGGMNAIICIGESTRDSNGDFYGFLKQQILSSLKDVPKKLLGQIIIAYEPIWAVGAREAISPRDLHEMTIFIKKVLKDLCGVSADGTRILYGGDADRVNADELVKEGNVSGLLVGRESLNAKDFIEIIKLVDSI